MIFVTSYSGLVWVKYKKLAESMCPAPAVETVKQNTELALTGINQDKSLLHHKERIPSAVVV